MTGIRETRTGNVTGVDPHGFTAKLVSYGPADSFNTRWAPGVFTDSLRSHLPVLAWGHDWADPIGRATAWEDGTDGPYMTFRLDDPDKVPRAGQALAQLQSGTLTDVSVGILRRSDEPNDDGSRTITRADLDEVSLVLRGAVPGARVLAGSVRSADGMQASIPSDVIYFLAGEVRRGRINTAQADQLIEDLADRRLTATQVRQAVAQADEVRRGWPATTPVYRRPGDIADAIAEADELERRLLRRKSPGYRLS